MKSKLDFERLWLGKLSSAVGKQAGEQIRQHVMSGSEGLNSSSDREEVISWSQQAMTRLVKAVSQTAAQNIMTSCSCQYPKAELREAKKAYQNSGSIDKALAALQESFEEFLKKTLHLDKDTIEQIVSKGWGSAGVRKGKTIIATKIPKSGNLVQYMNEQNDEARRALYCHCPRVRDLLQNSRKMNPIYCYCGAGFYKGIWENILEQAVQVEVLESVMAGGNTCKIAIHLP